MRRREKKKNDILLYLLKVYKQKVSQEPLTKPCADLRARAGKTGRKMVALVTRSASEKALRASWVNQQDFRSLVLNLP